jgi:twitching motility two-component system response regulator PilG
MKKYPLVLCALAPRDAQMVQLILARTPFQRMVIEVVAAADERGPLPIALVDANLPESLAAARALTARIPALPVVYLTDQPGSDPRRYSIERRKIWSQFVPTLESVIQAEFLGNASHRLLADEATVAPAPAARAREARAVKGTGLRALVVDDSAPVRVQMQAALQQLGLQVTLATQAAEARTLLQAATFDVMFLDVVMPGVDGYTFCRELRASPALRALPVVMLTSQASIFDRTRGALAGCDVYLTKPIELDKLRDTVDAIVAKRAAAPVGTVGDLLPQHTA